ncbi:hypothetical protein PAMA_001482 [Pampus argenteus]
MLQESVKSENLHHRVLIAALIVLAQDLSGGGGAQAWTYNYSTSPNRRWLEARQWCQQHFTDMVAIQNQEETDFLNNLLPFHPKYYWIGMLKLGGMWTWVGTKEIVPEDAPNWAPAEPDTIPGQDCVEMYIKREKDTAKWNNEKCRNKKGTVCYTVSCTQESCSAHADCVETIGNYTCRCHPGFLGPRCEEAISCTPLLDPEHGSHYCLDSFGSNRFNASCHFHCELGFQLVGAPELLCQASGHWDHPVPLCQAEKCPVLNHANISGGNMNCSHPIAPHSYNSTCEIRCNEGYELSGQEQIRCDHTGQWTASVPACTVKKCSPIIFPTTGNMTCVDTVEPFSYGSECNFTCQEGFYLTGENTITCLVSGQWSKPAPACTVVRCSSLKIPPHASMQCQDPLSIYSYSSVCTVQCDEGFDLIGTNMTKCLSQGNWSHALPICQAKRCRPINPPHHGSLSCSDPHGSFSFGSQCNSTCEEGFLLNGTAETACTSDGMWSEDIPLCLAKRCPTLTSPPHGSLLCSKPHGEFSFGSRCTSTCEEGFVLNGTVDIECTSQGVWSRDIPHCLAKRCPTLNSPPHGSIVCSDPYGAFSFGSRCESTCEEGFIVNGTADRECTSVGTWSTDIPLCLVKRCPTLNFPAHGTLTCSDPHGEFSFGSQCNSTCEEGFLLNGTAETACTSDGMWSEDIPHCLAKRCPTLTSPPHGSLLCFKPHGEFSFGSHCTSTCEEGFVLNGTVDIECTSQGEWSRDIPHCLAKRCPTLNSPPHGSIVCSDPNGAFSFGSRCESTCEEGFIVNGTADRECTSVGTWSTDIPLCLVKRCPTLNFPAHGTLTCSDPHGEFSFGSQCNSTCEEGFVLNGAAETECTSVGTWSTEIPRCTVRPCPLLAEAPQHGTMNCSHPYSSFSYGSHCDFECNEGFWLRGTPAMTCNNSGHWSDDLPTCQLIQCEAIHALSLPLSMNCSHPLGNFSFGSQCIFTCKEGFFLNGTEVLFCSSTGFWSDTLPKCTVEEMSAGTAFLLHTGVGVATAFMPLVLIGLALLIMRLFKKRGNANVNSYVPASWGERENPAFEI